MRKGLKRATGIFLAVLLAAQLIRPERSNPETDPSRTIQAHPGVSTAMAGILHRSCGDCHSNATAWPWYTGIAPLSWLMAYGVKSGRAAVNFSEWGGYPPERQRTLLGQSCQDVTTGKMPGSAWTFLHQEARLSPEDIATICAAAREQP